MAKSIFLSHNVKDKPFVRRLAKDLSLAGVRVWLDEAEIKVGESLLSKIEDGILDSDFLGVVLSPNSVALEWVKTELRIGLSQEIDRKKVIVLPLLLADCQMPMFLSDKRYAEFRDEAGYAVAFSSLATCLGVSAGVVESKDNWLAGQWNGRWLWKGQHRIARFEFPPSKPKEGRMVIEYSKSGVTTVVEQDLLVSVQSKHADLIGQGYRFLERGRAVGYHLDSFGLNLKEDGTIEGSKRDKRGIEVPVRFQRYADGAANGTDLVEMAVGPELVRKVFEQSVQLFLENEVDALMNGVSERNNCGRLANYMQDIAKESGLDGYYADVEYNRQQNGQLKTIIDDQYQIVSINCDLILHSRGKVVAKDNLIAIEMKKSDRPAKEKKKDKNRLRALTKASYNGVWSADGNTLPEHVCGYVLGAYIEINRTKRICLVEYYSLGDKVQQIEHSFY